MITQLSVVILLVLAVSARAQISPDTAACSGQGILDFDTATCDCFDCYTGDKCETLLTNCTVDATVADGQVFMQYWESQWNNPNLTISIPPWYRPSYADPFVIPAFSNPFNTRAQKVILGLHDTVKNANTANKTLVLGDGSTQVMRGIIYAISQMEGRPMNVYARTPFYPVFKDWADENPLWSKMTDRTDLDPSTVIEIITIPNNPDGQVYPPVYTNAKFKIYDMVYYWPHVANVNMTYDEDIMVFSSSKLSGHASSRLGWTLLKDQNLAFTMIGFLFTETFGVSVDTIYRQLAILGHIQSPQSTFFQYSRGVFQARWAQISALFAAQSKFTLESVPGTWFAYVRCPDTVRLKTCLKYFEERGIEGENGFGPAQYVRFNLNLRDSTWPLFTTRLEAVLKA